MMAVGDHIFVERDFIEHHGVDVGEGWVIHFASSNGKKSDANIRRATLEEFLGKGTLKTKEYGSRLSPKETVARAESKIGGSGYDLFANNCEHFATWCITGEHSSAQVEERLVQSVIVGVGSLVPTLGVSLVVSRGAAVAKSGPNLMSGLARVGGNGKGGMIVLGGVTATATCCAMCIALRDKPYLPECERHARQVGRRASVAGGAIGVAGAVSLVGILGVSGYSAAGLSSGLAELGSFIGGGMTEGIFLTMLIPVLVTVAIGFVAYRVDRFPQVSSLS